MSAGVRDFRRNMPTLFMAAGIKAQTSALILRPFSPPDRSSARFSIPFTLPYLLVFQSGTHCTGFLSLG